MSHPVFLAPNRLQPNSPLFVFLPGMDGTGRLLRTQIAGLERGFDVRCLAIPPDDLTGWKVLAKNVVELIHAELNQTGKRSVYLCGESFGGCLAMQVALHAPWLVDRLILVNPASSFHRKSWVIWGSQMTHYLPESLYPLSAMLLLPFLANLERIARDDQSALLEAMKSVPQKTSIWRLSLLNQFYIPTAQLRRLTHPVLLLASGSDRLLPSLPEAHHLATILPDPNLVTLPHSGHACLLEAEVNLYEIIEKHHFLAEKSLAG
jgi:pimeloyl-ACP methyl ester carboxylesterase